jgi:hypothetical protein
VRSIDNTVFENFANGTVLPSISEAVFRGSNPTDVVVDVTWAQFNDTTIAAPISYQTGWLMGTIAVQRGDQADMASFASTANSVSMNFVISRADTYLRVLVLPTGTFLVVLGGSMNVLSVKIDV